MEFEQNGRTYGIFVFGVKMRAFLKKKRGGEIRPDFKMWFQCLLLRSSLY